MDTNMNSPTWKRRDGSEVPVPELDDGHLIAACWHIVACISRHESAKPSAAMVHMARGDSDVLEAEFDAALDEHERRLEKLESIHEALLDEIDKRGLDPEAPICPYCGAQSEFIDDREVYRRHYGYMYICWPCDARVGVHEGTRKPKGSLANAELRAWRKKAHTAFDPLWQGGEMGRNDAYAWLAEELGIDRRGAHIGMFDVKRCQQTILACVNFYKPR